MGKIIIDSPTGGVQSFIVLPFTYILVIRIVIVAIASNKADINVIDSINSTIVNQILFFYLAGSYNLTIVPIVVSTLLPGAFQHARIWKS